MENLTIELYNEYDVDVMKEALGNYVCNKMKELDTKEYHDIRNKNIDVMKLEKAFGMLGQIDTQELE